MEAVRQDACAFEVPQNDSVVGEDELPHDGADHERDEERHQQHEQEEVLLRPAVERDPVRDRERDHQVDQRRRAREVEAVDELRVVQAELPAELAPVPGHHAGPGLGVAALQRQGQHHHQRDHEQGQQPQPRGQAQQVRRERPSQPGTARAAPGQAPWVIGKNRLFHAVSSSWFLYW